MDKISVIVPIYNSEKYLDECIKSILEQTYENFELILVNDGSNDKSIEICNNYQSNEKRIKVLNLEHNGVSNARNKGIDIATGQWICFVDSDDIIDKTFLKTLITLVKEYKSDIAEVDFGYMHKKYKKIKEKNEIYNSYEMAKRLYSTNGIRTAIITNKLYNIDLFKKIKFDLDRQNEDDFIIHKLLFATKKDIVINNKRLYWYRIHNDSRNLKFDKEKLNILDVFQEREKYFISNEELLRKNKIAKIDMILYLYHICQMNNKEEEKEILKNKFKEEYKKLNVSLGLKRKIKYQLFNKYPKIVSYIILLRQRKEL